MDDAQSMCGFDSFRDLLRDGHSFVERDRTFRDPIRKRRTLDELENERGRVAAVFEAVDVRDVRMVQRREHFRFTLEPRKPLRIGDERLRQNFQRNVPLQLRVPRAVDLPHPARTDGGDHFVRTEGGTGSECHRRQILYRGQDSSRYCQIERVKVGKKETKKSLQVFPTKEVN